MLLLHMPQHHPCCAHPGKPHTGSLLGTANEQPSDDRLWTTTKDVPAHPGTRACMRPAMQPG